MKILLSTGIVLAVVLAFVTPRVFSQTQAEMTQRANDDADRADKALNATYKELMALLDDEGKEKLKTAQRAWLKFRDAEAEVDADYARGGSLSPQLYAIALKSLTEARTAQLQAHVDFHKPHKK
jgi:uncharacterized protein YecT (DUF1311 family)